MAEGEGFEPPSPFGRQFSRLLPCAVRLSLRLVRTKRANRPPLMRQSIESSQRTNGLWGDRPESSRRGGATRQYDRWPRLEYREQGLADRAGSTRGVTSCSGWVVMIES